MSLYSRIPKRLFQSQLNSLFSNTPLRSFLTTQSQPKTLYSQFGKTTRFISTSPILFMAGKVPVELKTVKAEGGDPGAVKPERKFTHVSETFGPGKYRGTGLPKPVGQPDDLPSIEFGKPTGMYNFVRHQHEDPRAHLQEDGRFRERYATDSFHWYDAYTDVPKQTRTIVNGEVMIKGVETRPMEELFGLEQTNVPFYHRRRMNLWGNHAYMLMAEYGFFWIPTVIIFSLTIPCLIMLYMVDEAICTTMTVKVIGHQWYWVYEVETPPAD